MRRIAGWMMSNRPIDGILLLNKPTVLSSNQALQRVKRLLGAKKVGHTGSLDPLATGMLPLCLGEATKYSQYLLNADKTYQATGMLGVCTTTGDAEGEVTQTASSLSVSKAELLVILERFQGVTQQVPSMFSALKHQGRPLYELARAGIEVERAARTICVTQLTLDAFDGIYFEITVTCSKGTYIRNLVEDIGMALGVGAHVTRLHRRSVAGFEHAPMYTLERLEQMDNEARLQCLLPPDTPLQHYPAIQLTDTEAQTLRLGQVLRHEQPFTVGLCRLYAPMFIGLGEYTTEGVLKSRRLSALESQS